MAAPRNVAAGADAASGASAASMDVSSLPVLGKMPEFTNIAAWFDSPPLSSASLRGKVVLVDFRTYSCVDCIRTLSCVTRGRFAGRT